MLVLLVLAARLGVVAANCAYGTSAFPRLPNVTVSSFGYDGLRGPLNWFGLNQTANVMCEKGTQQSPIIINSTIAVVPGSSVSLTMQDYPGGTEFENLGTNVEVLLNGSLVDSGVSYSLAQCHFHTPAEHRLKDEFFPMEMHCVFESTGTLLPEHELLRLNGQADESDNAAKQFAVVAFLIELCNGAGCADPVLDAVFAAIDDIADPGEAVMTGPLAFEELIAKFTGSDIYRCVRTQPF
jgi:carbonic anhydrase